MINFKQYIKELQTVPIDELTEHSKRSALEDILKQIATQNEINTNKIIVLHEPKRRENYGSPDFKIYTNNSIIGYVENKKITENLDKILKTEQIKKYRELSQNILLTNYIDFVWIKNDLIQRETLCYLSDIENKKFKLEDEKAIKVEKLLTNFFSQAPIGISNAKDLALALAVRSKNLKDFLNEELIKFNENDENNDDFLFGLYKTFKDYIFKQLTVSEFSDAFAQMLVYGLFLAKLNADTQNVTLENAKRFIPQSFQLIKELVSFLDKLDNPDYSDTKWIIDETISIMNNLELIEIKKSLLFSKRVKDSENIETDPYIYFYETFLAAYDSKLRKAKGVYYTPPQVVNFIIRAINDIIKTEFHIGSGFAAPDIVTVLDFATGTGTFLIEILRRIFDSLPNDSASYKEMLIKDHILKNLYGFEYLIAPYTIAHIKLSQFLKENGYELKEKDRFQLFLTNTLEPIADIPPNIFVKALSNEGKLAQQVKDKPILVITGNPPYSGHSKNTGDWITNLLKGQDIWAKEKMEYQANYFEVDGKKLNERNTKWLQDDYVKFIRFAQYKIDKAGEGIVGIITNHSFLDNPTFNGMRQSLMKTFDRLYFIDLHGNSKKQEKTPEGEPDKNVFDIEQGVCISIMIKKKGLEKKVFHTDFWGTRIQKFEQCLNNSLNTIEFNELKPSSPFYVFTPQNEIHKNDYNKFWGVKQIFSISGTGVITKRDKIVIDENLENLKNRLKDLLTLENHIARQKYEIGEDSRDWVLKNVKEDIKRTNLSDKLFVKIAYRVFDERWTYYTGKARGVYSDPVFKVFNNFSNTINFGLVVPRQTKIEFRHSFITQHVTDLNYISTAGSFGCGYIFPLYLVNNEINIFSNQEPTNIAQSKKLYENAKKDFEKALKNYEKAKTNKEKELNLIEEYRANLEEAKAIFEAASKTLGHKSEQAKQNSTLQENFSKEFRTFINQKYNKIYTPEQILGYIYSILHSQTYRTKYAVFLKIDFPKIPFCETAEQFEKLSNLGLQLIEYHLLKNEFHNNEYANIGHFKGDGDNIVIKPDFQTIKIDENYKQRLYINKTQYFEPVSEEVFNFHIGGYQVLDKYLKDRKNKKMELNDITLISKIIKTITFTIKQMKTIDNETKNWI